MAEPVGIRSSDRRRLRGSLGPDIARLQEAMRSATAALNLVPSENRLSPLASLPLGSDLVNRYFFNDQLDPGFWQFRGGQEVATLETALTIGSLERLARADFVNVRPISGMSAMLLVLAALGGPPGGHVVTIDPATGGHYATSALARRLGLEVTTVPVRDGQVDLVELRRVVHPARTRVVYLDLQNARHELAVAPIVETIREVAPDTFLHVDCSHTLGLVLGGAHANPLDLGATSMGGSTHKTFPGPHKGAVFTRSGSVAQLLRETQMDLLSSHHLAQTISLGFAAAEFLHFGQGYARQVVRNARALGQRLHDAGFDVILDGDGHVTSTHQVWVRIGSPTETDAFCEALYSRGVRANVQVDLPGVAGPILRLGVNEMTFRGGRDDAIATTAALFEQVLHPAAAAPTLTADDVTAALDRPFHLTAEELRSTTDGLSIAANLSGAAR